KNQSTRKIYLHKRFDSFESQLPLFIKNHQMYFSDYEVHYNDNDDFVKYVYYTCSKNLNNKLISKERGLYTLAPNGKWWLS
ncbi:MAG: hypothetical protein ACTH06_02865, partial [Lactobacillus helveticus]